MQKNTQTRHTVYRAIEGWAHGIPGFLAFEWAVLWLSVLGCFVVSASVAFAASAPIGGAVLAALVALCSCAALLFLFRRQYDGRREAVYLMTAKWFHKGSKRHRMLDVDTPYRPYRPQKREDVGQ